MSIFIYNCNFTNFSQLAASKCQLVILYIIISILNFTLPALCQALEVLMSQTNNANYQQWKTYQGLIYDYYSDHVTDTPNITHSGWLNSLKSQTFKYKQLQFYCINRSTSNQGILSTYNISVPKEEELNDTRTRPVLNLINSAIFKRPITHIELFDSASLKSKTGLRQIHIVALSKECLKIVNTEKIGQNGQSQLLTNLVDLQQVQKACSSSEDSFQIGQIAFAKNINSMKSKGQSLLLGCDDGQIVEFKLDEKLNLNSDKQAHQFKSFTVNKNPINDLVWLQEQQGKFIAISKDGNGYLYDVRSPYPSSKFQSMHLQPTSIIQIRQNEFVTSGRDCLIKFWDIRKQKYYTYSENDSVATKMINLTGIIKGKGQNQHKNNSNLLQKDQSTRFATCGQNGTVTIWQNQPQFIHMGHRSAVNSIDYSSQAGLFISSQSRQSKICVWKPTLNINYKSSQNQYS